MDNVMMRQKSLAFRRLSSNLLTSTREDADVNLARFAKFIDEDEYVSQLIHGRIDGVEYDFSDCFQIFGGGWSSINIPLDEDCHLKAQYDFIKYILDGKNVLGIAMHYPSPKGAKYDDIIRDFLSMAFKPMIDYIVDSMSMEMIVMDEKNKVPSMVQNINTLQGNAIQQSGDGTINATANVSEEATELLGTINMLIGELKNIPTSSNEEIESVLDDLESLKEQVNSDSPKPSRMKKALTGIKKFGTDVLTQLIAGYVSGAMLQANWPVLIQQAETYISGFLK